VMFKTELLAYLYNLSERQVEQFVNDSLSAKWFLGLAVDKRVSRSELGGGEKPI